MNVNMNIINKIMKTVKLNTGVVVTFDNKENMISVSSPYIKDDAPSTMSVLRYAVEQLKKLI